MSVCRSHPLMSPESAGPWLLAVAGRRCLHLDEVDGGPSIAVMGSLDGNATPSRWAVLPSGQARERGEMIAADEANEVAGDLDGDRLTDEPIEGLSIQSWSSGLNAGDTVVFRTTTTFSDAIGEETAAGVTEGRIVGTDRIDTAVRVSQAFFGPFGAQTVVLARSDEYADALAGSSLAARVGGPMLLNPTDGLDERVGAELRRLRASTVILLGGESALSGAVEGALVEVGVEVQRVAGADRFQTAARIAQEVIAPPEPGQPILPGRPFPAFDGTVYITEGADEDPTRGWPDAVAASAIAGRQGRPILLVTTDEIPASTSAALADLGVEGATIVGGETAVSTEVQSQITSAGVDVERVAGDNRTATAEQVLLQGLQDGLAPRELFVTSGERFADALVAGAVAAGRDASLITLTPGAGDISDAVMAVAPQVQAIYRVGGGSVQDDALLDTSLIGRQNTQDPPIGRWSAMSAADLEGRSNAVTVWTGERAIFWGGLGKDDGATYDPDTDSWEPIADAPFEGRSGHQAVWTGEEMLVWSDRDGSSERPGIGAYDPAADSWRTLPEPPLPDQRSTIAEWSGEELLVWGNTDDGTDTAGAGYDPASDTWRAMAAAPIGPRISFGHVIVDGRLVIVGGVQGGEVACPADGSGCPAPDSLDDAAVYEPETDTWTALPDLPFPIAGRAVATDDGLVMLSQDGGPGVALDLDSQQWTATARPPSDAAVLANLTWTGETVLTWQHRTQSDDRERGGSYDPARDEWTLLPPSGALPRQSSASVWTGDSWLVWSGFFYDPVLSLDERPSDGLRYTPGS